MTDASPSEKPVSGYFEGERLELIWRYAYPPEIQPLLMNYLGAKPGMKILDSGCGTGFLTRLLAKVLTDVQVVGVDMDEKLLDLGRQMLVRENLIDQVELRQGDAYHLPFSDETFDLVTSQTLLCVLGDPVQGLHEKIRVTKKGQMVSAIACFCHSGNLPHYHGRYLLEENHRIDELDLKMVRTMRVSVRPKLLGVDHTILSQDLFWQFKNAGLKEVQINGHLVVVSPGDARIPIEEGAAYALARNETELNKLIKMREKHGAQLAQDGFSETEFDELISLKQKRYEFLREDPSRVRDMMEVFNQPIFIIRGTRPNTD